MHKLFLCSIIFVFATSSAMEKESDPAQKASFEQENAKYEVGFNTQHYQDFLRCYFKGKETKEAQICYMNFCLRDSVWLAYKNFLENGGAHVINVMEKPTSDSIGDFLLTKKKLQELENGVKRSLELIAQLELDHEKKSNKKKKKFKN